MAPARPEKPVTSLQRKRKQAPEPSPEAADPSAEILPAATLSLHLEDDDEEESEDDDFEPIPEINDGDDSEGSEESAEDKDEDDIEETDGSSYLLEDSDFENSDENEEDAELYTGPKAKVVISDITGRPKKVYPEIEPDYDSDSSTEEDPNRIGNVPLHWYDDLPHIGYNIDGKKVLRPAKGDELDKFLSTVEDPTSWTSGFDKSTQSEQQLSPEELDIIRRLQAAENPDAGYDPYEPTVEWYTGKGKEMVMPISSRPEPKRRWQPSKWEKKKVMKIVRAIRQGRIVPRKPTTTKPDYYQIWSEPASERPPPLVAPKVSLPGHAESYNPPEEYLPDKDEKAKWEKEEPEDRERNFLPQKFNSLRTVPGYDNFIQERFSRLLDLYLAPRVQRKKLNIDPESLLPSLPAPETLKPFPVYEMINMSHERRRVRAVAVSPDGHWMVTGDETGVVRLLEAVVGREAGRYKFPGRIGTLAWCPRQETDFFLVGVEGSIHAIMPVYMPLERRRSTLAILTPLNPPVAPPNAPVSAPKWSVPTDAVENSAFSLTPILSVHMGPGAGLVKHIAFHRRGDYFASIADGTGVCIHQIAKRSSQMPFKKTKGQAQRVLFHPNKPHFFLATQRYVRVYDLSAQKLLKTLKSGSKWISSMDIHPGSGDHLIIGGYDRKLAWFDLELSDKPYKVLKYHTRAVRSVRFHPTLPLFATASDDGTIQIFHAMVYSDYMTDPLIVPLKSLKGHKLVDGLGVLDIEWCRNTPWLVSAGSDGNVKVWAN